MKVSRFLCLSLFLLCIRPSAALEQNLPTDFASLLDESGLMIKSDPGYQAVAAETNEAMPYEHALRHRSGALEVRFSIRPIARIQIEYNDPHNAAPEPNHLFPLLFESLTNQLSIRGGDTPSTTLTADEAEQNFNAHWAAISVFDLAPEVSDDYRNAILVAIHKNDLADAYALLLYNNHEFARPLIEDALSMMTFDPVPAPPAD